MIGAIDSINLIIDPKLAAELKAATPPPTATPTPEPTEPAEPAAALAPGDFLMTGAVEQEVLLKESDLKALNVVKITAEHPKKGKMEFEGVLLSDLFALAKPKPEATNVVVTASDGFSCRNRPGGYRCLPELSAGLHR